MQTISTYRKSGRLFILRVIAIFHQSMQHSLTVTKEQSKDWYTMHRRFQRQTRSPSLRMSLVAVSMTVAFCAALTVAQDKVAEGEYESRAVTASGASVAKMATRWVLYGKRSTGYRLESEIQKQPMGMRVVQIEELTDHLVPTAIGYDLYRKDQQKPDITALCDFPERSHDLHRQLRN